MSKTFNSFGDLSNHLKGVSARLETSRAKALETIGENTAERAQEKLGVYQDAFGQFREWPELAPYTKEDRVKLGFSANDPLLRTGELRATIGFGVEGDTVEVGSTHTIAPVQEFGEPILNIPARPFIGPAMAEEAQRNALVLLKAVEDSFNGD